jgi:hypothetical protein
MLKHLIKLQTQPERESPNWRRSIVTASSGIASELDASPSLRRYLEANRIDSTRGPIAKPWWKPVSPRKKGWRFVSDVRIRYELRTF